MNKIKDYSFKDFKEFLVEHCYDLIEYKEGRYDRKIYNWFDVGKPKKVNFFDTDGNFKKFKRK